MPVPRQHESRQLQRLLNARWWELSKGQILRLRSGNVRGEAFEVEGDLRQSILTNLTVSIPTDFATLQEAIDGIHDRYIGRGTIVDIVFETGHNPASGAHVANGDYSMIRVGSEDAVLTLDSGAFTGHFLSGEYAAMPVLGTLVDMGGAGQDGYHCRKAGRGFVDENGGGIRNAGDNCLYVNNSQVEAPRTEFTGAGQRNVWLARNAAADMDEINASGACGLTNVSIRRSSLATLFLADLSGSTATEGALTVVRSRCHAEGLNASGASNNGLTAREGSHVMCASRDTNITDLQNCGGDALNVNEASKVDAHEANCSGAGGNGIRATASEVDFENGTADNCTDDGMILDRMAKVNSVGASVQGNTLDCRVLRGSQATLLNATTTSGSPAVGDTNVGSFNSIDSDNGIIWA